MPAAKAYILSAARLLPLAGGTVVIPPTSGGGTGDPGGGDPGGGVGDRNSMLVGAATTNLSGSDFEGLNAVAGPWTVRRSYENAAVGFPFTTWAASRAGIDVGKRASVWSCKPDLAGLAAGSYDAQIKAFVASIPDTHVAFLSVWHEVDGKIRKGTTDPAGAVITKSAWLAAAQRFFAAVKSVGKPHVYTTMILEAWSGQSPKAGTTFADLWPGDGLVDVFGVDGYSNTGTGAGLWGPAVDFARSKGVAWGIAEVGCATTPDTAWMQAQADYAGATAAGGGRSKAAYFCWFSNATGGVLPTPGTDPAMQAKAKSISQTYYTDVNAYLL
jgi:hypothetical protein